MITLTNINMKFRGKQILYDINLQVEQGETMVIIGPSGSGKSTILRLIIGLLKPTDGQILVKGQEITCLSEDNLNKVRMGMGMVFQYSALFDSMTVGENVAFGLREHTDMSEKEISKIVARNLRMVGLSEREHVMPNELSGGMKKRVSLARAIAMKPEIMLYDEPTAGLDPIMSGTIDRLTMNTKRMLGVTSVVVTHQMSSAFAIADRIAMIHGGRIIEIGSVMEIKQSKNPLVQQFIHGLKSPGAYARMGEKVL
jgi:phospholipid/cholesterol/gamma-HCH transport system ATP-binding protein